MSAIYDAGFMRDFKLLLLDFFVLTIVQTNESLHDNIVKSINTYYEGRQKGFGKEQRQSTTITRPTMKEGLYWFTGNGKKLLVIKGEPRRKTGRLWNAMLRIMLGETTRDNAIKKI